MQWTVTRAASLCGHQPLIFSLERNIGDTLLIPEAEQSRLTLSKTVDPKRKSQLGQFFTPVTIARFMADLFTQKANAQCRLLDAGAGIGSLCCLSG